jgi:Tfp pilus assembly protein PilF
MAPEQKDGLSRTTTASDIYALGMVAHEMVSGRLPAADEDAQQLDPPWRTAISTCLHRDPDRRFKSATDFVDALEAPVATRSSGLRRLAGVLMLLALAFLAIRPIVTRWFTGAAVASNDRIVAVLPFTTDGADPGSQAYGRGLAASLTDDLRYASSLERGAARVVVIPAAEMIEGEVKTANDAQRLLSANVLIAGRLERGAITMTVEEALDRPPAAQTQRAESGTADPVLVPATVRDLARLAGVTLSPRTVQALDALRSATPEATAFYIRGKGLLTGPGADLAAAADAFQRAIELDRRFAMAHAALGDAYLRKYRATLDASFVRRAQASADDAIGLSPPVAYAHVIRGRVYQASGQNERAIRELQAALEIDPGVIDARRGLAEVFEAEGALPSAEEVYRQEIAASPQYFAPHVNYGSFLIKRGRYREAETSLVSGLRYAPDNARAIGNLAGLYILTERLAAAETELKRSLALKPDVVVCNNLAWVQIYQEKFQEAVQFLEQAVRLPFADSFHWGNLARAYRWAGQTRQAQDTYRKAMDLARQAIDHNPRDARIRGNYAQMLAETGRGEDARVEIAATLERAPKDVSVLFRSALISELTGDRAAALRGLEAAVRAGYSLVDIRRHPDLARLRDDPRFVEIPTMATSVR